MVPKYACCYLIFAILTSCFKLCFQGKEFLLHYDGVLLKIFKYNSVIRRTKESRIHF